MGNFKHVIVGSPNVVTLKMRFSHLKSVIFYMDRMIT
jgi:hypothetical protein